MDASFCLLLAVFFLAPAPTSEMQHWSHPGKVEMCQGARSAAGQSQPINQAQPTAERREAGDMRRPVTQKQDKHPRARKESNRRRETAEGAEGTQVLSDG